jgi:hypothetical protein
MGKHFIDPKSSEILVIIQVFPCTTQIALFWPKLLPALFLKKPRYPCPLEILEETLKYPTGVIDSSRKYFSWPSLLGAQEENEA